MEITKITANDYNCLKSLFKEEYDYHLTFCPESLKEKKLLEEYSFNLLMKNTNRFGYKVKKNGKFIGFILCYLQNESIYIEDMCITKHYARKGIGTLLINMIKIEARLKKKTKIETTIWGFNNKSQKLFENQKAQIKKIDYEINLK